MKDHYSISVVSPIYNNSKTINLVLHKIIKILVANYAKYEIILIDDASTDNSVALAQEFITRNKNICLLVHKTNQGIAKTYRELYALAKYNHIVLFSLDGEWEPEDIPSLFKKAILTNSDLVVGERKKKSYSLPRLFVSKTYNFLNSVFFGVATKDAGSIKYITKDLVKQIPIISHGVFDEAERIIRAKSLNYKISSVTVSHYPSKKTKSIKLNLKLIAEAILDCFRVYISLFKTNNKNKHIK